MTSSEHWLPIPSCPGYFASDHGRIRRGEGKILNPWGHQPSGKMQVHIVKPRYPTSAMVARLVAEVFCPTFHPKLRPSYLDGDPTNCRPDNLQWVPVAQVTVAPLGTKQGNSKLTEEQVLRIRRMARDSATHKELAAIFQVSPTAIFEVIHRHTWKHLAA